MTFDDRHPPQAIGEYVFPPVECAEALAYREALRLPREPRWPLHLTFGNRKSGALRSMGSIASAKQSRGSRNSLATMAQRMTGPPRQRVLREVRVVAPEALVTVTVTVNVLPMLQ